jgi:hypothetical protein
MGGPEPLVVPRLLSSPARGDPMLDAVGTIDRIDEHETISTTGAVAKW